MKSKLPLLVLLLLVSGHGYCYDVETHRKITKNAVMASTLTTRLPDLGFFTVDDMVSNNMYDFGGKVWCFPWLSRPQSIIDVIAQGAVCEDATSDGFSTYRYTNHFYDPAHGGAGYLGSTSSLLWGLETTDIGLQMYSYKDALGYFYKGLTLPVKGDRDTNLMMTFRALGQVMHLIQDMAQPQHTRNDSHALGSSYEKYTDEHLGTLTYGGYEPVQVSLPDQFWHTADNKGLADYSNRGFVTVGTNFTGTADNILPANDYPLPDGSSAVPVTMQITDLLGPVGPNQPLSGEIQFIGTTVRDEYTGVSATNPRTSSYSLFDSDLRAKRYREIFALNRFTFDEAHKLLIPRAVGYSAGLLNHFFRGKMEISLPDEGVYGVLDHNDPASNAKNTGGFTKIKLKVQNLTLRGAAIEPMTPSNGGEPGNLVAVAKFHRNNCYTSTLSGEYGSPGIDWHTCRGKDEEIVVSQQVPAPTGIDVEPTQVEFNFPKPNQIPINATDLFIQVVYRGPLGDEPDAVAVVTRDISEPTYAFLYSKWDQLMYGPYPSVESGPYTYDEWCLQGYPTLEACNQAEGQTLKLRFSPTSQAVDGFATTTVPQGDWADISLEPATTPIATLAAPVGTLARIALLTDAAPANWAAYILELTNIFFWGSGTALAATNQLDATTGALTPSIRFLPGRGVYLPDYENSGLTLVAPGASPPPLTLIPSTIQAGWSSP